jgi:class 3 adenylate cyclase
VVASATRDLVGADRLRDLGVHRLKDLAAPERLYQLGDGEFPPPRSVDQTNLPVQLNASVTNT